MNAGVLNERVAIQSRPSVQDGQGGLTGDWSTVRTVWARVTQPSARRQLEAGAVADSRTYIVRLRAAQAPTIQQRLVWRKRELRVDGVTAVGDGLHYVDVTAVSEVA